MARWVVVMPSHPTPTSHCSFYFLEPILVQSEAGQVLERIEWSAVSSASTILEGRKQTGYGRRRIRASVTSHECREITQGALKLSSLTGVLWQLEEGAGFTASHRQLLHVGFPAEGGTNLGMATLFSRGHTLEKIPEDTL